MILDKELTRLGRQIKNLIVIDVCFTGRSLMEFRSAFPNRLYHYPSHEAVALQVAAGMASLGNQVVVLGTSFRKCDLPDSTLNVKLVKRSKTAQWEDLEQGLQEFGASLLLIPEDE